MNESPPPDAKPRPSPAESNLENGFRLAGLEVRPRLGRIGDGPEMVRLEPQIMAVLVVLARHAGEAVTREQLFAEVWQGRFVSEDVLHRAISKLRATLGDDARAPRTIETIPKIGYRLLLMPEALDTGSGRVAVQHDDSASVGSAPGAAERRAVASQEVPTDQAALQPARSRRPISSSPATWITLAALLALGWVLARFSRTADPGSAATSGPELRAYPLTGLAGEEHQPAVSPDGRFVAFSWAGPDGANRDIWVKPVDGGEPIRVTVHPAIDRGAAFSPDGTRLGFVRHEAGACEILLIPAFGGSERSLGNCQHHAWPRLAFSPDNRFLVFTDRPNLDSEPQALWQLDLATLERRRLLTPPVNHGDAFPAFSPDGRFLVFARGGAVRTRELYRLALPAADARLAEDLSGREERLTNDGAAIIGLATRPGGEIVFASDRDGQTALWSWHRDREPRRLPVGGGDVRSPSASRDGRRLAFEDWQLDTDLWRLPLAAGLSAGDAAVEPAVDSTVDPTLGSPGRNEAAEGVAIAQSSRLDQVPALSPNGAEVAFVSTRSGHANVWVARFDGGMARQVTDYQRGNPDAPRFSPDGQQLAFDLRAGNAAVLCIVAAAGGAPRCLPENWPSAARRTDPLAPPGNAGGEDVAPRWSPDGALLFFGSNRGDNGVWQVYRTPLAAFDGDPTALAEIVAVTREGGASGELTATGDAVLHTRLAEPGLFLQQLSGPGGVPDGAARRIVDDLPFLHFRAWVRFGSSVVYLRDDGVVAAVELATGRRHELASTTKIHRYSGLAITPDGGQALLSRVNRQEVDVMMLELP